MRGPGSKISGMANPALLNKVDKLFASGVGEYVSLPQIVAVGDQSSGKSSVLEALTGLPFPRDSDLCTRFATQIRFCRAPKAEISISIIPASGSSGEHAEACTAWSKPGLEDLDPETFSSIMREAHTIMGIDGGVSFSDDVLCIEIYGPDQEHFSVVDVPGIFRKTTEGVTTKADKIKVEAMVRRYMENPRSIILAVVPANVDIATQEILTMAEEVDPDGHRTLGVLTKPDLVDRGAESAVISLIEGKRHKLTLGWCVVRNPGQSQLESSSVNREAIETAFFQDNPPWNTLEKDRVGIGSLRLRLQEILASNIRREFPKVKNEIHKRLNACRERLDNLGAKRETADEQRQYLLGISERFQKFVMSALSADYVGDDWFDKSPNLRFATAVVNRNEALAKMLAQYGHSYTFDGEQRVSSEDGDEGDSSEDRDDNDEEIERKLSVRAQKDPEGLEELPPGENMIVSHTPRGIFKWLSKVYGTSRGFELGTFDGSLLAMTMKTQSSKWEPIAVGYIKDIISMAHTFVRDLLHLVCPDLRVWEGLMSVLMDELLAKYKAALDYVHFLLRVERAGTPATLNHYFADNLEKCRQKRIRAKLQKKAFKDIDGKLVVSLEDIVQNHHTSNVEHVVQEIHDILQSYYKVARKRFADNICMQAADHHIVTGPCSPLRLFGTAFVSHLSDEQLMDIAGEDAASRMKRATLTKEIAGLEAGKKIVS
ncbi:hypothetical protein P152DRAFT_152974 [Eremomyces bilateralis CBS 781.70]|uniref:Dynamin family protein n=1 Tax=Eremomyces bilateralis CBS 781.70 TaxID=1392243 RepID=A0A6G1FUY7_9PEZI|nr:uncharacterized protein P152DRAFT_152974 [Eremomyces bilateralis CBS 781.70]KAF1809570.1 hypothetical protein P152DRAFT_152974 [Eremomyces bilateralis CBS 781.70]